MIRRILKALPVLALFCYFCQAQGNQATALKPNELAPTHRDISYGSHPKELINFWQFDSDQPVGVLLQIHGGGWMGGKKDEVLRPHQIKQGYHIASISYPLVNEGALQPAMLDSALRAVQFLRCKAKDWKIDSSRIVATGGSAGVPVYWSLCMMILPTRRAQTPWNDFHPELLVHRSQVRRPP
jgi:acetyl esterase/lipase